MNNTPGLVVTVIIVIVVGAVVLYYIFSPTEKAKRRFKKTPLKRIADCKYARGPVRIQGRVEYTSPPLIAPMSGRHCAYFEFKVNEKRSSGKSSHWVTIIDDRDGGDFAVVDDSGKAIIDVGLAKILLTKDDNRSSGTFNDATPRLESTLAKYGETSKGWIFNKSLRYEEGVLEQGEDVSVAGFFEAEEVRDPLTGAVSSRPVFRSTDTYKLVITDDPKLAKYKGDNRESF